MTIEAGAKVATGTIDALKTQPLALALIVINVLFLASAIWLFHEVAAQARTEREQRGKLLDQMLVNCGDQIMGEIDELRKQLAASIEEIRLSLRLLRKEQPGGK